jgi:hypothetical protein
LRDTLRQMEEHISEAVAVDVEAGLADVKRRAFCPLFAVEVASFGDRRHDDDIQQYLRDAMYKILMDAFARSGLAWDDFHHEDRGNGLLVAAPAGTSASLTTCEQASGGTTSFQAS